MTIQTDIANFRIDNACTIAQLPDTVALRYYNDSRDIVIDRIVQEKEDFFYNEMFVDTVIGKREYVLPKRGDLAEDGVTTLDGIKKIKEVGMKTKATDTVYTKLPIRNTDVLEYDLLSYSEATNVSPFYVLSDTSVFVYPTPTEDVNAGLVFYSIMQPKKVILTDTETLSDNINKVILLGLAQRWFTSQKQYDYAQAAEVAFNRELSRVGTSLSGRVQSPKQRTTPNLLRYT